MGIDGIYGVIVIILFALSITDLIVGVSNDAVNFLNSSIGSKVASRKTILIIAGLGIFAGAFFSNGMMEIARKGIFVPELFTFHQVLIVFLAVMLTDILLLDFFNTLGMPTSTTVSIVFELLGASVAIALIHLITNDQPIINLSQYINSAKALQIISGIFLSILFAFTLGTVIQYVSRLAFTFDLAVSKPWLKVLFFALSTSGLAYFLVFKGLGGVGFIPPALINQIVAFLFEIMVMSFIVWALLGAILLRMKVNLLKVIVLFGTFALAMSFAGNDLVNFIGVSIAALASYDLWMVSGLPAEAFYMSGLSAPIQTNTFILVGSGAIMVATLWLSKKAQSVTETEVNLGRQHDGDERFKANLFAVWLVTVFQSCNLFLGKNLPKQWMALLNARFIPLNSSLPMEEQPAFDLLRAAINLTVASVLISLATSLKLPLSTTYVSFMVAMGTSLADRAWSSASAANRISGVMNVVGGWLLTAIIAFSVAFLFAAAVHFGGVIAVILLIAGVFYSVYRTFTWHRKRQS